MRCWSRPGPRGIFGTKERSVIKQSNAEGIRAVVAQQFEVAKQVIGHGLMPIVEPEVDIHCPDKAGAETLLKAEILAQLDKLPAGQQVMLKLTLPAVDDFFKELVAHPRVLKVVALSGGYSRDEANARLARQKGMIASFSRAADRGPDGPAVGCRIQRRARQGDREHLPGLEDLSGVVTVSEAPVPPSAPAANVVDVHGVRYVTGSRAIFDGLDISVARGSITAVMGPSGTGKTTLLRLLTGQIWPSAGTVQVLGQDVGRLSQRELFALRKRMGMLFQNGALLTDLNVFENVAFPVREHARLPEPVLRRLVLMKLEAVGLRGAEKLMPQQLSGGMARRVALARAIVMDPEVLIYDEPFVGLDPVSMGIIVRLIRRLNDALGHHQHRGLA